MISIVPVRGIGEVQEGQDLGDLIAAHAELRDGDVVVVTQKVVSKAEGRLVPSSGKTQAIEGETKRVLRRTLSGMVIAETHHGFVCANAGVDESNIPGDRVALLPVDPDASARRIRSRLQRACGVDVAVIVSDTFGRAWRIGQTDVAIGIAGMSPFVDHIGKPDTEGREMTATKICIADEIAGAAELVMGKVEGICAVVVRGAAVVPARAGAREIVRPVDQDLFR
jgi:coenzyme F420-0:L-glutamate ligase/coenzyme F420-1:gamma-L-glutamate ligase